MFVTVTSRVFRHVRRGGGSAALAAVLTLLAGCATTPVTADRSLSFPTPKRFEAEASPAPPQLTRWWARFGSRELDALMRAADDGNLDVATAVAQLAQAEALAQIAGAGLWPVVGLNADASRSRGSGTMASVASHPKGRNSFGASLGASYVVDVWGRNRDLLEAAVRSATASAYQIETVRATMRASLVNAYLTIGYYRERARVAQENLRSAERVLRVYQLRKAAGTVSDLEIAQQTTLMETLRASAPPLRQGAEQARVTLAALLGKPAQAAHPKIAGVTGLRAPTTSPGLPSSLLLRRPDIRAAEENLKSAEADLAAARKALLPTISLTGEGGLQSGALSRLLRPESVIYSLAAGLAQPIFDGGKLRAQVASSDAERQALLETYRKAIVSALSDVESALIATRESAAAEAGQSRALASAKRAFALSEDRLKAGTIDLATSLAAQQSLFQAQEAVVQARYARLQASVSLFQALGGDWSAQTAIGEAAKLAQHVDQIPLLPLPPSPLPPSPLSSSPLSSSPSPPSPSPVETTKAD